MKLTSEAKKHYKEFENEMYKLNTELQIALLKWKITWIKKKQNLIFKHNLEN